MKYLSINKSPYALDYTLFQYETKALITWGTIYFHEKEESKRVIEIWGKTKELLEELEPNIVLTHLIDLRYTLKRDLVLISQMKTLLRKICYDLKIIYNEFKTDGWEKRLTNLKQPSKKAKLDIAHEYNVMINRVEIANALILGEGVVHGRLQIGRD